MPTTIPERATRRRGALAALPFVLYRRLVLDRFWVVVALVAASAVLQIALTVEHPEFASAVADMAGL